MYPHDYYDIHGEPRLHNVGEGRPYLVNDYHANDHGPQLPGLSTIGRGPRGEGLYVDNVVETDSKVSFGLYSDLTGKLVWQSPNLVPSLIDFIPTPAEQTVAGKPAPLTIKQTRGNVPKSTIAYLPAGEQGSRIYVLADPIQKSNDDIYNIAVADLVINGRPQNPMPAPRINDVAMFCMEDGTDMGLAFGNIVSIANDVATVVARGFISIKEISVLPLNYEDVTHIENIPLKRVAGHDGGSEKWASQLGAVLPVEWGSGKYSTKEYGADSAYGLYSHAEGYNTTTQRPYCHAEGQDSNARGTASHVEGYQNNAIGDYSHAEGNNTIASGRSCHAEGAGTTASESYSHAEGSVTIASGYCCHAEGNSSKAFGSASHAEGAGCEAGPNYGGHAEGKNTKAKATGAHSEGDSTEARNVASHAEGQGTIAYQDCQHVSGRYNSITQPGAFAEIVGWGSDDNNRKNIRTLDTSGNEKLAGDLTVTVNGVEHTIASLIARIEALES